MMRAMDSGQIICQQLPTKHKILRVAVVTETYPPEINGVAMTICRMVAGLQQRQHQIQLRRPRQSQRDYAASEPNFEEVLLALILIPIAIYMPVSGIGKALMVASVLLVLIVELLNSGLEAVTDRISLEDNVLAKRAKDLGSAAVMLSLVNVPVVWLLLTLG